MLKCYALINLILVSITRWQYIGVCQLLLTSMWMGVGHCSHSLTRGSREAALMLLFYSACMWLCISD